MNDKPELKPCPFCGGEACCSPSTESDEPEREDREPLLWGVGCGCTAFVGPWSTEAEAIAAWNTRATPSQDASALVEVLKAIRELCPEVTGDMSSASLAGLLFNIETRCDAALTAWEAQHG